MPGRSIVVNLCAIDNFFFFTKLYQSAECSKGQASLALSLAQSFFGLLTIYARQMRMCSRFTHYNGLVIKLAASVSIHVALLCFHICHQHHTSRHLEMPSYWGTNSLFIFRMFNNVNTVYLCTVHLMCSKNAEAHFTFSQGC